jgi:hypothetical protein
VLSRTVSAADALIDAPLTQHAPPSLPPLPNTLFPPTHSAVITDGDRALLSLKAQRKKLEDQMKLVRLAQ